jgi:hypothetical protein
MQKVEHVNKTTEWDLKNNLDALLNMFFVPVHL